MLTHGLSAATWPARTAVIGAGGFVGRAIADAIASAGAEVVRVGRPELDLLAPDAGVSLADRLADVDAVVIVSAIAPCRNLAMMIDNLRMAEAVVKAVERRFVPHAVYISSDAVYADGINPIDERSRVQPTNSHGIMHAAREVFLQQAFSRASFCILRPSLIYGARDPHNGYGPNRFRRQAEHGEPITLFGEGEELRDHVHVADVARIAGLCLQHRSAGVLNVATGRSISFRRASELTIKHIGRAAKIVPTPRSNPITHRHFDVTARIKAFPGVTFMPPERGIPAVIEESRRG